MFGFTKTEVALFRALNSPTKIQNFLNKIPSNFEPRGETCLSPRLVLQQRRAHCLEGALLAATILRFHGYPPLVLDLTANEQDKDHVIAVFRRFDHWGAISKTNHATLRYREPVYRTLRELVMSFFHEYFLDKNGRKTLRSYSHPVDLRRFDHTGWMTDKDSVWYINDYLFEVKHYSLLSKAQLASLRPADMIERKIGKLKEWDKSTVLPHQKLYPPK